LTKTYWFIKLVYIAVSEKLGERKWKQETKKLALLRQKPGWQSYCGIPKRVELLPSSGEVNPLRNCALRRKTKTPTI